MHPQDQKLPLPRAPRLLTFREAADYCKVPPNEIRWALGRRELQTSTRPGSRIASVIAIEELDRWLQSRSEQADGGAR